MASTTTARSAEGASSGGRTASISNGKEKASKRSTSLSPSPPVDATARRMTPNKSTVSTQPPPTSSTIDPKTASSTTATTTTTSPPSSASDKPLPNYLKPTIKSTLNTAQITNNNNQFLSKPILNRRRSFNRPPSPVQPLPPKTAAAQGTAAPKPSTKQPINRSISFSGTKSAANSDASKLASVPEKSSVSSSKNLIKGEPTSTTTTTPGPGSKNKAVPAKSVTKSSDVVNLQASSAKKSAAGPNPKSSNVVASDSNVDKIEIIYDKEEVIISETVIGIEEDNNVLNQSTLPDISSVLPGKEELLYLDDIMAVENATKDLDRGAVLLADSELAKEEEEQVVDHHHKEEEEVINGFGDSTTTTTTDDAAPDQRVVGAEDSVIVCEKTTGDHPAVVVNRSEEEKIQTQEEKKQLVKEEQQEAIMETITKQEDREKEKGVVIESTTGADINEPTPEIKEDQTETNNSSKAEAVKERLIVADVPNEKEEGEIIKKEEQQMKVEESSMEKEKEGQVEVEVELKRKELGGKEGESKAKTEGDQQTPRTTTGVKAQGSGGKKKEADQNEVIEETATKLMTDRKNKVKALAGAFQTVINSQDK